MTTVSGFLLILLLAFFLKNVVKADPLNPQVLDVNSTQYHRNYPEWSAKWWQWALEIPQDKNPIADVDGRYCAVNQNLSSQVWFLAGTGGGRADRQCTIPHGVSLFFPILSTECSYAEDSTLKSPRDLLKCAKEERASSLQASIDGTQLRNLESYRVDSPIFKFTFPEKNIFGAPSGQTQGVSDGWFLMLKPLKPGHHVVEFRGQTAASATPTLPGDVYVTISKYNIDSK